MIRIPDNKGMTLVEVMIALAIIVGIAVVAQQYHSQIVMNNRELLRLQESLLVDESEFDKSHR